MRVQTEPLLKLQTKEYMEFIRNFTETVSIMTKSFFIVVPFTQSALPSNGNELLDKLNFFSKKDDKKFGLDAEMDFEEKRSQLEQRVGVVQQGLASCGIKSAQLGSEEVIEAFYKVFNPGEFQGKIDLGQK